MILKMSKEAFLAEVKVFKSYEFINPFASKETPIETPYVKKWDFMSEEVQIDWKTQFEL